MEDDLIKVSFHKNFEKKFKKHDSKIKKSFLSNLNEFESNPFSKKLNNHALKGKYTGYRSINVTGDMRAIFILISKIEALFVDIDNHSNLYK